MKVNFKSIIMLIFLVVAVILAVTFSQETSIIPRIYHTAK